MAEEAKGLRGLIGKRITKKTKFMGETIEISKLKVIEVQELQEKAKALTKGESTEDADFEIVKHVIRAAAEGAADMTDEEFEGFPLEELASLSNEIIKYSGIMTEGK
jgi:hypothetical protein